MLFELSLVGESLLLLNFASIKFKTEWKSPLYIKYLNNMPCVMDAPLNLDGIKFPSSCASFTHCSLYHVWYSEQTWFDGPDLGII